MELIQLTIKSATRRIEKKKLNIKHNKVIESDVINDQKHDGTFACVCVRTEPRSNWTKVGATYKILCVYNFRTINVEHVSLSAE